MDGRFSEAGNVGVLSKRFAVKITWSTKSLIKEMMVALSCVTWQYSASGRQRLSSGGRSSELVDRVGRRITSYDNSRLSKTYSLYVFVEWWWWQAIEGVRRMVVGERQGKERWRWNIAPRLTQRIFFEIYNLIMMINKLYLSLPSKVK